MPILINNPRIRNYYRRLTPIFQAPHAYAYFMLILSLLSLSFFGAFAIRPTLATIVQLQKQIFDSQEVYQKLQEKNKNLLLLQGEYKKMETDLPVIYAALPPQIEAPNFLLKVRTLASLNNLQIKNLQVAKAPLSQNESSVIFSTTFSLTAEGIYRDLDNFLIEMAILDRIVTFENIGITPSSGTGISEDLTLQVTGKIYALFD